MGDEVLEEVCVMVGQAVLHHGQHVEGRVGEVLEPMGAPVQHDRGHHLKCHQLVVLEQLHKGEDKAWGGWDQST